MFPSVACSSYFGYFVQFSRCGLISVEIRFKHLFSKCLNPTSTALVGPISDGTREVPRSKRFGTAKTLPQAEFTSAEDVKSCRDPILMPASKWVVGPSGLEPPTSRLSVVRSSQLSYGPSSSQSPLRSGHPFRLPSLRSLAPPLPREPVSLGFARSLERSQRAPSKLNNVTRNSILT